MYTVIRSVALPADGARWTEPAIGDIITSNIFTLYKRVYAVLEHPALPNQVCLDLELIRGDISGLNITFSDYLISIGDKALPVQNTLPKLKITSARFNDAVRAGYKITPTNINTSHTGVSLPEDKTWLRLVKRINEQVETFDYRYMYRHCLINVNGLYHQTDADDKALYVRDGNKSALISGQNTVGIYSFKDIGSIQQIPIADDMIIKMDEVALRDTFILKLPEVIGNRTVGVVVGGYLHILDTNVIRYLSDDTISVTMQNLPLIERYFESKGLIDLSSVEIEATKRNPEQIFLEQFFSDPVMRRYLQLSQSFVVLIDTIDLFKTLIPLRTFKSFDVAMSLKEPIYPMISGSGLSPVFWKEHVQDHWELKYNPVFAHRYNHHTTDLNKVYSVDDHRQSNLRSYVGQSLLLKISKETVF